MEMPRRKTGWLLRRIWVPRTSMVRKPMSSAMVSAVGPEPGGVSTRWSLGGSGGRGGWGGEGVRDFTGRVMAARDWASTVAWTLAWRSGMVTVTVVLGAASWT